MKTLYLKLESGTKPKHLKIYNAFVEAIRRGQLKPGDILPSTRELAQLYRCSRLTVMNAMQSLKSEAWIDNFERSHYSVSTKIPITFSRTAASSRNRKIPQVEFETSTDFATERQKFRIEFWGGQPDIRHFPMEEFRKVVSNSLRRAKPQWLNYGHVSGLDPLHKELSEYLRRTRNIVDKELIVTNGSQEALALITKASIKPGDKVAIERKGYAPAWRLFENFGAKLIPINVDEEGLNTDHLEEALSKEKIKMIYVTPLHQYPTTVTLSPGRRSALIKLAEKYSVPILEDDYDHEFHYLAPPPPPLATETDFAFYIGSFSKVLFPGARLGVIACHPDVSDAFAYQKYLMTRQTDALSQLALAYWIKDGGFERHMRKMRRLYEKRFFFMIQELESLKQKSQISWRQPNGGMSIWVNLQKNSKKVSEQAKKHDVLFQNESDLDFLHESGTHLRIGFAGVNEAEIRDGFQVLLNILNS